MVSSVLAKHCNSELILGTRLPVDSSYNVLRGVPLCSGVVGATVLNFHLHLRYAYPDIAIKGIKVSICVCIENIHILK